MPAAPPHRSHWEFDVVLADGGTVHLRPLGPPDADRRRDLVARAGTTALRAVPDAPDHQGDHLALGAMADGDLVAVAGYHHRPDGEGAVTLVVDDDHAGGGLGTLLLEYLAAAGREHGVARFVAGTRPDDQATLAAFRDAGYQAVDHAGDGVVELELPIAAPGAAREVVERREQRAEARALDRVLRPKSIAVVGASSRPGTLGQQLFLNLLGGGFAGPVHPVNAEAAHVAGVPAHPSVLAVPGEVDLVVVAVPAPAVADVVAQCGEKGVKGVVVVSTGFADAGPDGAEREREVALAARRGGMRLVGPGSLGVANAAIGLDATFAPRRPPAGRAALLTRSGALGLAALDRATELGVGVSSFVSTGDAADVTSADLLRYWEDDPATDVVLLYLDRVDDPRRFARVARRVSRRKPIVAVKSTRTPAGARASVAATGATPAPDDAVEALFGQAGVVRVDTLEQLVDVARVLEAQPLPAGDRIAVLANGRGPAALAVDALAGAGTDVATLSDATGAALAGVTGRPVPPGGEVVVPAAATADQHERAVRALLADPGVDALLVVHTPPVGDGADDVAAAIRRASDGAATPVVAAFLAAPAPAAPAAERVVPAFTTPEAAAVALARVARYAAWRAREPGEVPAPAGLDRARARRLVAGALDRSPDGAELEPAEVARLLGSHGVVAEPSVAEPAGAHPAAAGAAAPDAAGVAATVVLVHDATFGPVVEVGVGGPVPGRPGRRGVHLLPLTDRDAAGLVDRVWPVPVGAGEVPPAGAGTLADLLVRVGLLADELPELVALDLDAVVDGGRAVVSRARARVRPGTPSSWLGTGPSRGRVRASSRSGEGAEPHPA